MKNLRILLALALITLSKYSFAQNSINKPNIVYILADDLGYGELGAYGQQTGSYLLSRPFVGK